jgi:hypothetical protein
MAKKRTTKEEKRLKKKKRSKQLLPVPQQMIDRVKERGDAYLLDPPGEARMSEVIVHFAEPLLSLSDDKEYFQKVVPIAIMAWNASFLPPEGQSEIVEGMIRSLEFPESAAQAFRIEIEKLIERRLQKFSHVNRLIVDYEMSLTDYGNELFVASTLPKGAEEQQ